MPNIPFLGALFGSSANNMADNADYPVKKPEGEWQAQLSPEQFRILRQKGTEMPGSGKYNKHYPTAGVYNCGACDAPLYKANHKFDSGCGWPAFWDAIPGAVGQKPDPGLGMMRTEISNHGTRDTGSRPEREEFMSTENNARYVDFPYHEETARLVGDDKGSTSSLSSYASDEEDLFRGGKPRRESRDLHITTDTEAGTGFPHVDDTEQTKAADQPVSWSSLPRKDQLFVLMLARLSEPLTQTSLGSYLYYQLQSFDPSLPESTISYQAGIIGAAFPATQFVTAMMWGRFSDSEYGGRKRSIYLGLLGTMLSIIGFGFSHSFAMAVTFRCLGGILNGNVGVMRTMISEIIKEKKFQSRAFLILPMIFNIGVIVGPVLGGVLADPIASYPSLFGPNSTFGGKDGVYWMKTYPYALPNLISAIFLFLSSFAVLFFLEETSDLCKHKPDPCLRFGHWLIRTLLCYPASRASGYTAVPNSDVELHRPDSAVYLENPKKPVFRQKLPFRRIWTANLSTTLLAHGVLAMHVGTFNGLWNLHLSTPRYDLEHPHPTGFIPHGIFFTGGLGMPPSRIGLALAIIGVIGIPLQLLVYPRLSHRLGTTSCYRIFLALFPVMYTITPFLSLVPSTTPPPEGVSGPWVWMAITGSASVSAGDSAWDWAVGF
ncbi:PTR2, Dipeptide-tripeptide permease [Pyrenophora tritici-repentis]|uniref:PTR2, Dipeptide-tripeptide permease n=1 Tax=Pyrenophora tritici-repentis TaxID=45151 RepID=A0A834RLL7_9PLEO|nr:PTR2, Dipeptide-tripeptide permease [Pyrenophora tritici-repentis]